MRRKIVLLTILVLALFTLYMSDASISAGHAVWAHWMHPPVVRAGIVECLICRAHTNCDPTDAACLAVCQTQCSASEHAYIVNAKLQ